MSIVDFFDIIGQLLSNGIYTLLEYSVVFTILVCCVHLIRQMILR